MGDPKKINRILERHNLPVPKKKKSMTRVYKTPTGSEYKSIFRFPILPESIDRPLSAAARGTWSQAARLPQEKIFGRGKSKHI